MAKREEQEIPSFVQTASASPTLRDNEGRRIGEVPTIEGSILAWVYALPAGVVGNEKPADDLWDLCVALVRRTGLKNGRARLGAVVLQQAAYNAWQKRAMAFKSWNRAKTSYKWVRHTGCWLRNDGDIRQVAEDEGILPPKGSGIENPFSEFNEVLDAMRTGACPYLESGNYAARLDGFDRGADTALAEINVADGIKPAKARKARTLPAHMQRTV